MRELEVFHTHLYPGARGRFSSAGAANGPVTVVFADGNRVPARLDRGLLTVEAHRTAAGTQIARKAWQVAVDPEGLRVTERARP